MNTITPTILLLVGLGGAVGAVGRFLTVTLLSQGMGQNFPYGTVTVNVVGGLLMGLIVGAGAWLPPISPDVRLFLTTGVLGGFTTFSAFSLEVATMVQRHDWSLAALYSLSSVVLSVLSLMAGVALVRMFAAP